MNRVYSSSILFFGLALAPAPSWAQSSYQPHLLGLRTAGMGGAGVAFGHDSAMAWRNPAGTALSLKSEFGVAANSLVSRDIQVNGYYGASPAYQRTRGVLPHDIVSTMSSEAVNIFPSSAAFTFPVGEEDAHYLTLSMIVPYAQLDDEINELVWDTGGGMNVNQKSSERTHLTLYDFGGSWAARLADTFRFGVSAFLRYAPLDQSGANDFLIHGRNTRELSGSAEEYFVKARSLDLEAVLGVQIGPFDGFSIGLAAHGPSIHLAGTYEERIRTYCSLCDDDEITKVEDYAADGDYEVRTPPWFTAGLGFESAGSFALAADASVWLPVESYAENTVDVMLRTVRGDPSNPITRTPLAGFETMSQERILVVNVNVGAEVYLNDRIILRGGFFTDFSNAPDLPSEDERTEADKGLRRIDRLGGALGVAYQGPSTQFQLGVVYLGGLGEVIGLELDNGPTTYPTREIASNSLMLAFSGEIDAGEILSSVQSAVIEEVRVASSEKDNQTEKGGSDVR